MIFLYKDYLSEEDFNYLDKEKEFLSSNINIQKKKKEFILDTMQQVANLTNSSATSSVNQMFNIIENLKNTLDLCTENISTLDAFINNIDNMIFSVKNNSHDLENILKTFNTDYFELYKTFLENSEKIETYLCEVYQSAIFQALESSTPEDEFSTSDDEDKAKYKVDKIIPYDLQFKDENIVTDKSNLQFKDDIEPIINENTIVSSDIASSLNEKNEYTNLSFDDSLDEEKKYVENTLTVSEALGKVTLPYSMFDVKETLKNHPDIYTSVDSVIKKKYTVPIQMFKNAPASRFKEAYKLIRHKEHGSITDGFELGLELMFNYKLHPAIITACKSLDELDIYLDFLESGQTNKFNCFNVIFDLPPMVSKKRKFS